MKSIYQFPATRFVKNTLWRQWWHLLSEVIEIGRALLAGKLQHAAAETWDAKQSSETLHRILAGKGADVQLAQDTVIGNNEERGYYESPPVFGPWAEKWRLPACTLKCWNKWCIEHCDGTCLAEKVEIDAGGSCWTAKDKK